MKRLRFEALTQGTTYLESKTGYGLDVDSERRAAETGVRHVDVVSFLGAHVVPDGIDARDYVDLVTGPMLAAELGAASVDHCNHVSPADLATLSGSTTVATLLPARDLSTRQPLAPARALLDAGVTVALATNCNPGTSFTTSMQSWVATAVLQMGLSIEEAVWAATRGGARALQRDSGADAVGVQRVGGRADFQVLHAPSVSPLAYRPGVPLTIAVWQQGQRILRPALL